MDTQTLIDLGKMAAAVAAFATVALFAAKGVRWLLSALRRVNNFLDDWNGEPARPGVTATPGVMDRLARLESKVVEVRDEVKPNGGASMRDAVNRIAEATGANDPP